MTRWRSEEFVGQCMSDLFGCTAMSVLCVSWVDVLECTEGGSLTVGLVAVSISSSFAATMRLAKLLW